MLDLGSSARSQRPSCAVNDKNGLIKFVPTKGTEGRPYGGNNGALLFRVWDGFANSDLGTVYVVGPEPGSNRSKHQMVAFKSRNKGFEMC